jgi:hypothetical protein
MNQQQPPIIPPFFNHSSFPDVLIDRITLFGVLVLHPTYTLLMSLTGEGGHFAVAADFSCCCRVVEEKGAFHVILDKLFILMGDLQCRIFAVQRMRSVRCRNGRLIIHLLFPLRYLNLPNCTQCGSSVTLTSPSSKRGSCFESSHAVSFFFHNRFTPGMFIYGFVPLIFHSFIIIFIIPYNIYFFFGHFRGMRYLMEGGIVTKGSSSLWLCGTGHNYRLFLVDARCDLQRGTGGTQIPCWIH